MYLKTQKQNLRHILEKQYEFKGKEKHSGYTDSKNKLLAITIFKKIGINVLGCNIQNKATAENILKEFKERTCKPSILETANFPSSVKVTEEHLKFYESTEYFTHKSFLVWMSFIKLGPKLKNSGKRTDDKHFIDLILKLN